MIDEVISMNTLDITACYIWLRSSVLC